MASLVLLKRLPRVVTPQVPDLLSVRAAQAWPQETSLASSLTTHSHSPPWGPPCKGLAVLPALSSVPFARALRTASRQCKGASFPSPRLYQGLPGSDETLGPTSQAGSPLCCWKGHRRTLGTVCKPGNQWGSSPSPGWEHRGKR